MKRSAPCFFVAAFAVSLAAGELRAQPANDEVMKVVTNLFDGMRKKDTTLMRSTLAPQARLLSASTSQTGTPVISEVSVDRWITSVGLSQQSLDERVSNVEIRVDGNLATAWMKYEFWGNSTFSHCGYNSFQLARTTAGWKIIHIADSRRTEGCR